MSSTLAAVFIGGGLGSLLRWALSLKLNSTFPSLPLGTLTANLIGSFIIGIGLAFFARTPGIDPVWRLLLTTGFCGGLTTFSTFSAEVVYLLQEGKFGWALSNIMLNLAGSLTMTLLAFYLMTLYHSR